MSAFVWLFIPFVLAVTAPQGNQTAEEKTQQLIQQFQSKQKHPPLPEPSDLFEIGMVGKSCAVSFLRHVAGSSKERQDLRQAARLALLRLDDAKTFEQVVADLNSRQFARQDQAISLLSALDNKAGVDSLIEFLRNTQADKSMIYGSGDAGWDPRIDSMRVLSCMVPPSEVKPGKNDQFSISAWLHWWQEIGHALPARFDPPRPGAMDNHEAELLDRIEWRVDPGAVLQLADAAGASVLPYLRRLADVPQCVAPPPYYFGNVAGNAQAAASKLGDTEMFQRILDELSGSGNPDREDAVDKLEYIGDTRAVRALIDFLDESSFPRETRGVRFNTDPVVAALRALSRIVPDPPVSKSREPEKQDIVVWKTWAHAHLENN